MLSLRGDLAFGGQRCPRKQAGSHKCYKCYISLKNKCKKKKKKIMTVSHTRWGYQIIIIKKNSVDHYEMTNKTVKSETEHSVKVFT